MTAREAILSRLRAAPALFTAETDAYRPPISDDLWRQFAAQAEAADAIVHEIGSPEEVPQKVAALLADRPKPISLHIPEGAPLTHLAWQSAQDLTVTHAAPEANAIALSQADFAVAETGTLVFQSGATYPSSWHFLPEIECVLLRRNTILPTLEDLFARLEKSSMPATLNLVTGPSRTADIEQTIERGAHGPRALHILVADT